MSVSKNYLLKSMVIARGLAELTVLVILAVLPLLLFICKQFLVLHVTVRAGLCILAPLALLGIIGLGRLPFRLVLDDTGLSAIALFGKTQVPWLKMKTLRQGSRIGFRQCRIVHENGELSFPCLFNKSDELIEQIRSRLPNRGRSITGDAQLFRLSSISFSIELGKLVLQGFFAALFLVFFLQLQKSGKAATEDLLIVLGAVILISLAVLWKFYQVLRLPQEVRIESAGLSLLGPFGLKQSIAWSEISGLELAGLIYPDGKFLKTGKKTFLLSSLLDGFDELCEEVSIRAKSRL